MRSASICAFNAERDYDRYVVPLHVASSIAAAVKIQRLVEEDKSACRREQCTSPGIMSAVTSAVIGTSGPAR